MALESRSAAELARRIRRRELSPVEVLDATIARIEARNPSLNAFVHLAFDEARAAARDAERALAAGGEVGALHGVPAALKDLMDSKPGWPSTLGGIRALRDHTPAVHAVVGERLERAGAILVGKGNSPVMGFRGTCDNPLFGPTCNPFDVTRNSGGSSGGCAAAVADGLVPLAEGTDGGGSLRIPAAWCGIVGFKPSLGRVPFVARPNAFAGTDPFLFQGPLTRTVEDCALMLDAIAGHDPRDPYSHQEPANFVGALRRPIADLRIGYTPNYDVFPVDPRVRAAVDAAVGAFDHVEVVRLGIHHDQRELSDLWCRLTIPGHVARVAALAEQGIDLLADHAEDLPPQYRAWLERGSRLTVLDLARDQALRTEIYDCFERAFGACDLIVGPTVCALPVENSVRAGDTVGPSEINGVAVDELIGWCPTYLLNLTGHPAASVPAGLVDGLPVGLQIIGRRGRDEDVIAACAAFERLRPWAGIYEIPASGLHADTGCGMPMWKPCAKSTP